MTSFLCEMTANICDCKSSELEIIGDQRRGDATRLVELKAWMTCRCSVHGPENMSDRRGLIVPSQSLCGGEPTEFAEGTLRY